MDLQVLIMVDITKIDCKGGDEVIIFNMQEMIQYIADISETIVYETLTVISPRIKKILIE
jgi:alanine racemase